jgi:hypothetical protein
MTTGQLTYQFCIDNYNSNKEFIKRNKSFLDVFQSKIGTLESPTLTDEFFDICGTNQVYCGDIIPPFLSPVIHEFELSSLKDVRELIPKVTKIIHDFDSSIYSNSVNEVIRKETLVILYHQTNKSVYLD